MNRDCARHARDEVQPGSRWRSVIFGCGALLLVLSGCGGVSSAAGPTTVVSAPTRASPTPSATVVSAAPDAASDAAPLDPDVVPAVGSAGAAAPNAQPADGSTAVAVLSTLAVKGRAPKTGYARTQFGAAWADVDHNGCDTRNDILKRDLTGVTVKAGSRDCLILTGTLQDPYTATVIPFTRGAATSTAVQIDHVVALSDAWQKGAQQLTLAQRTALANDPLNLLAVDGPTNLRKSDGDAATWLPPAKSYRCAYVSRQISVKAAYGLWVTQAEHDAMSGILADCAQMLVPTEQATAAQVQEAAPAPAAQPAPIQPAPIQPAPVQPAPAPVVQPVPAGIYYANCAAVRAAGAAPIRLGQAGYRSALDRDGDGVGCE